MTRQRSGTGRPAVAEDGRLRRPCRNQRTESERKENMRLPQHCSMPAAPWRSVPIATGKPRWYATSSPVDSVYQPGTSFAKGFLLQNGAVDADNPPASPLSQKGVSHEPRTRGNVRRWRNVSAEGGLWSLSGMRLQWDRHDHGGDAAGPCRFDARLQHVNLSSQSTGPIFPSGTAFVSSFRGGRQCERSVARSSRRAP